MKSFLVFLIAVLAILIPPAVGAKDGSQYVARSPDGSVVVTLINAPCTSAGVLALLPGIPKEVLAQLHAADVAVKDRHLEACFMATEDAIQILAEDGNSGEIGMEFFNLESKI